MEWWSGGVVLTPCVPPTKLLKTRVHAYCAITQDIDAPLLQHSITPSLRFSISPPLQFLLVQGGAFVDIALWKANLFLLACLFLSVSSAVPGSPFRRLD
jgi:hypothetical protein